MKILCVIDNLGSGGAQRQLTALALGFNEMGHIVEVLTYSSGAFYGHVLTSKKIPWLKIEKTSRLGKVLSIFQAIKKGQYNVVLSFLEAPNLYCEVAALFFLKRRWKLVISERSANPDIKRAFNKRVIRVFHCIPDYITSNSHENIRLIKKVIPIISEIKTRVIYNALDLNIWKPKHNFKPRASQKDTLKLVIAASHQNLKNLKGLISALKLLDPYSLDRLRIEWYGDRISFPYFDSSYPEAINLIKEYQINNDTISFYPATENIREIIQNADIIGLFSHYEGMPNIVCEGMACGKPILCSRVSDLPNLLFHQDFLLFDPNSPSSIMQALQKMISLKTNELEAIGEQNRQIALREFSKDKIIEQYIEIFSL